MPRRYIETRVCARRERRTNRVRKKGNTTDEGARKLCTYRKPSQRLSFRVNDVPHLLLLVGVLLLRVVALVQVDLAPVSNPLHLALRDGGASGDARVDPLSPHGGEAQARAASCPWSHEGPPSLRSSNRAPAHQSLARPLHASVFPALRSRPLCEARLSPRFRFPPQNDRGPF